MTNVIFCFSEDLKNQDENNEYIFREMSQFHNQIECFEDALSR